MIPGDPTRGGSRNHAIRDISDIHWLARLAKRRNRCSKPFRSILIGARTRATRQHDSRWLTRACEQPSRFSCYSTWCRDSQVRQRSELSRRTCDITLRSFLPISLHVRSGHVRMDEREIERRRLDAQSGFDAVARNGPERRSHERDSLRFVRGRRKQKGA